MADFGATQPRLFIMDSSQPNGATLGTFHQHNNRYLCTLELFDNSVPVTLDAASDITIRCKPVEQRNIKTPVYVLDKNNPDFATKVTFTPGENKIMVDRWSAMVAHEGPILLGVDVNGMSTYTVTYSVDKDLIQGEEIMHHETPVKDLAKTDLSNVSTDSFLAAAKKAKIARNDLEDIDLDKLAEKINASDVGKDIKNLTQSAAAYRDPDTFNDRLKRSAAFVALSQQDHPSTKGLTPAQIEALFLTNRFEITQPVDLTLPTYATAKVLLLAIQLTSSNQRFTQVLPPVANDQIIMVEIIRSKNVTGGRVLFDAATGETVDGSASSREVVDDGYCGMWLPIKNENTYDWIGHAATQPYSLVVQDDAGKSVFGVTGVKFNNSTIEDDGNGNVVVTPNNTAPGNALQFLDGITGEVFTPQKVVSLDHSVRVSKLPTGEAELSVDLPHIREGVFATLGTSEAINTNYHDQRPYFTPRWNHTQMYVGIDKVSKGWTIQEGDMKDPNITGGSAFHLGFWFEPENNPVATYAGYVELKVVDLTTNTYLTRSDGTVASVRRDYKAGDVIGSELLLCPVVAKGQQTIGFEIDCSFGDQIIVASPSTAVYIQQVSDNAGTGLAELMFSQHVGINIRGEDRYYGYSTMDFASALTKDQSGDVLSAGTTELMGNGLFVDVRTDMQFVIASRKLAIISSGSVPSVFSIGKLFNPRDTAQLRSKNLNTSVTLQNKQIAFDYALFQWNKDTEAVLPVITGYTNDQPVLTDGWTLVAKKFIGASPLTEMHTDTEVFTVPADAKQIAMVLYPVSSRSALSLIVENFKVDVTPAFTVPVLASTFNVPEMRMQYNDYVYRGLTPTPSGYDSLRYTGNVADSGLPFGSVSGGNGKIVNDRSWNSPGNGWDFEGNGQFKVDGKATVDYDIPAIYCGEGMLTSQPCVCEFWMIVKRVDGTITEIPGSRTSVTLDKRYPGAKKLTSGKFTVDVKAGDSIGMKFKTDIDDGCYLMSGTDGQPLLRINVAFKELEEIDQRIIDLINNKK